jgi:plastocyanin
MKHPAATRIARLEAATGQGAGRLPASRARFIVAALAGLFVLTLSACGTSDASNDGSAAQVQGKAVTIEDLAYTPETLTVETGDTVTWVWKDGAIEHDVSGDGFKSELMSEGTFSHRFEEPGTFTYECSVHPNMTATIEVKS